jgi:signal transduction histidine kinase
MKLSYKYGLIITLLITLTTSILTITTVRREKQVILDQIQKKGTIIAEVMAQTSLTPLLNHDYGTLRVYCEAIAKDTDVLSVGILDSDHIIKMHTDLDMLGLKTFFDSKNDPLTYELMTPIQIKSDTVGYIHVLLSVQRALTEAEQFKNRNLEIALYAVLIGLIVAILMSRLITTPIHKLAQGAREISAGNLDWEMDIHSSDEMGTLADAFKYMTGRLKRHINTRIQSEKMAVIGRLSSGLAHEIRNPLEPIKGAATMLKETHKEDPVVQRYAMIIEEEVDTLSSFLNSYLDFARTQEPVFSETLLNPITDQVCELLQQLIQEKSIKIRRDFDPTLPPVWADPHQIKQVLMNILLNAIQALPHEGGYIQVSSRVENSNRPGVVVLEVYDSGKGIGEEVLDHIFDPFFTTRPEGTGLGLSISHTLVEQNGGTIFIESEQGNWTRVRLAFPLQE